MKLLRQIHRFCPRRFGRSIKKYLRTNAPWRPRKDPPQLRHFMSRPAVHWGGASTRTISYLAPQLRQLNGTDSGSDITPESQISGRKEGRPIDGQTRVKSRSLI